MKTENVIAAAIFFGLAYVVWKEKQDRIAKNKELVGDGPKILAPQRVIIR